MRALGLVNKEHKMLLTSLINHQETTAMLGWAEELQRMNKTSSRSFIALAKNIAFIVGEKLLLVAIRVTCVTKIDIYNSWIRYVGSMYCV